MKRTKYVGFLVILCLIMMSHKQVNAQSPYWRLNGNNWFGGDNVTTDYVDNMMGTILNNSLPLHFQTNGNTNRMMINEDFTVANSPHLTYPLLPTGLTSGWVTNVDGYVGLGISINFVGGPIGPNFPWTRLHIQNPVTNVGGGGNNSYGWRPWMKTGTFVTENSDHGYFGMKDNNGYNGDATDRSDCIINWGDNDEADYYNNAAGPDNLRFIFTRRVDNWYTHDYSLNPLDAKSINGREVARMTPKGYMGIGATFNNQLANRVMSLLHMHEADTVNNVYLQISNWKTGQTEINGMKLGLNVNNVTGVQNLAQLINQEDAPIAFYTNSPTTQNPNLFPSYERMRIYHKTLPVVADNYKVTRIAIDENGTRPIVQGIAGINDIKSLLHLGYNTSTSYDGWRPWMDIGTFTCAGQNFETGSMYVGLQEMSQGYGSTNPSVQQDAIINWGHYKDGENPPNNNLRFVFTHTIGAGSPKSTYNQGLEIARMITTDNNNGRMGIGGDMSAPSNPYTAGGGYDPGNTLEINSSSLSYNLPNSIGGTGFSGLRFTDLRGNTLIPANGSTPGSNPGPGVLAVDQNGDVIYVPDGGTGFGPCPGNLLSVPAGIIFHDNNIYFDGQGNPNGIDNGQNSIGIGYSCGTTPLLAKVDILRDYAGAPQIPDATALFVTNHDVGIPDLYSDIASFAIQGNADGLNDYNFGLYSSAENGATQNYGVSGQAGYFSSVNTSDNYGGAFQATNGLGHNTGVWGFAWTPSVTGAINLGANFQANNGIITYGVQCEGYSGDYTLNFGINSTGDGEKYSQNYGVYGKAFGLDFSTNYGVKGYIDISSEPITSVNYAIYGDLGVACTPHVTCTGPANWAGYFNGDVYTSSVFTTSDSTLKHNIQNLTSPMAVLNQLHPKSFEFNQQQNISMQLPNGTHFGVLAQELNTVLPQLTKHTVHPARYDSLGNMTYDSIPFMSVNYTELIPYLIAAAKQHDSTITQQNSTIQSLINQNNLIQHNLDSLWNALNNCCNITQNIAPNGNNGGGSSEKKLGNGNVHSIELSSASGSPILYQNIPNPFNNDGGTKIRYFVPDNMNSPMIVFFDEFGSKLQTFAITETGMGELDVTASNLVSGIYSYSLIINGKAVDTKKMVFQK